MNVNLEFIVNPCGQCLVPFMDGPIFQIAIDGQPKASDKFLCSRLLEFIFWAFISFGDLSEISQNYIENHKTLDCSHPRSVPEILLNCYPHPKPKILGCLGIRPSKIPKFKAFPVPKLSPKVFKVSPRPWTLGRGTRIPRLHNLIVGTLQMCMYEQTAKICGIVIVWWRL